MMELDNEQNTVYPMINTPEVTNLLKLKVSNIKYNQNNKVNNQFLILNNLSKLTINQDTTLVNNTSYCENNIEYKIYDGKNYILNCKEETTYCHRKWCNYHNRNIKLNLFLPNNDKIACCYKSYDNYFCFPKPQMILKYYLSKKLFIIKESYNLYESNYTIFEENNKLKYLLKFTYYYRYCCINCSFCKNETIIGDIYQNGKLSYNNIIIGKRINELKYNDFIFNISFPINMDIYDKFNIIICSILYHYKYCSIKESKRCYECKCIIKILLVCLFVIFFIIFLIFYLSKKSYYN